LGFVITNAVKYRRFVNNISIPLHFFLFSIIIYWNCKEVILGGFAVGKKVSIIGAGNVGATVAFTLTVSGLAAEIALVDINKDKAKGEALDIFQGTSYSAPVNIYQGDYSDLAGSDIVVITFGMARRPGQTRIDLAQANVNIIKSAMPEITKYAPDAVYVVVSNPVDILTYTIAKACGLPENKVIGTGTLLDSARLRSELADRLKISPKNIHAYVFGEHGDTAMIPWSLASIGGLDVETFCNSVSKDFRQFQEEDLADIEEKVKSSGARIINWKGATYYAIALTVKRVCECVLGDSNSILPVSSLIHDRYGIDDVAISMPCIVGSGGIKGYVNPPLTDEELKLLQKSGKAMRDILDSLEI